MLSRRRVVAGLAVPVLLALSTLAGPALAGPALAPTTASGAEVTAHAGASMVPTRCEASGRTLSEEAKRARAVFTGTVESSDVLPPVGAGGSGTGDLRFEQTVVVDRVYKPGGASLITSERVDVLTERVQGECSLGRLTPGARYVVFASVSDGDLVSAGDGGTALAEAGLVSEVEQVLGSGRLPVAPPTPTAELTTVDTRVPTTFSRAALPGAVLVLVGLLGLVVVRRFAR